jgi:glutamine cyclotransferase
VIRYQPPLLYFIFALLCAACGNDTAQNNNGHSNAVAKQKQFEWTTISKGRAKLTDTLVFELNPIAAEGRWDSVHVWMDDERIAVLKGNERQVSWVAQNTTTGKHVLKAEVYHGNDSEVVSKSVVLTAAAAPATYTYRIVATYPHDPDAFTQGLLFDDGQLIEGTGQKGASELRKVALESGEVTQSKRISTNLFGEGIALYNEHLYQLTWQAGIGLVYNKQTLEEVARFYYNTEGWGLTANDSQLIMSDGSNVLHFLDPEDFREVKSLEVYDNNGAIGYINELEWIDDKIYANVWQKDEIIVINPVTGAVDARINLSGIFPANQPRPGVLNGIATDQQSGRIFVTGKYWPFLFEVQFVAKGTTSS